MIAADGHTLASPPRRGCRWRGLVPGLGGLVCGMLLTLAAQQYLWDGFWTPRADEAPPDTLRLALCQYGTRYDSLAWNLDYAYRYAREAFEGGAHLVVLPEFSFHGFAEIGQVAQMADELARLEGTEPFARLARRHGGYLLLNHPARVEDGLANETLLFGPDGGIVARYHKRRMAVIDQRAGFVQGLEHGLVDLPFGRLGLLICRDTAETDLADMMLDGSSGRTWETEERARVGAVLDSYREADLIIAQLAFGGTWSPTLRSRYVRDSVTNALGNTLDVARSWARHTGAHVAIANKTGIERGLAFVGGSLAVCPNGEVVANASTGPGIAFVDLPLDRDGLLIKPPRKSPSAPTAAPTPPPWG